MPGFSRTTDFDSEMEKEGHGMPPGQLASAVTAKHNTHRPGEIEHRQLAYSTHPSPSTRCVLWWMQTAVVLLLLLLYVANDFRGSEADIMSFYCYYKSSIV